MVSGGAWEGLKYQEREGVSDNTIVRFCTTGESQCTNGFMNLDRLRELGRVTGGTLRNRDQQQRIIPSIAFRCNGSITKWIVAAKWEDGGGRNYFPELQIWRFFGRSVYGKINSSTLSATTNNSNSVYEHTPFLRCHFRKEIFLEYFSQVVLPPG